MTDNRPDIRPGQPDPPPVTRTLHASTVRLAGKGVLIIGPSGAGKSSLALGLMALGGRLVADDQTVLTRIGARLRADAPPTIRGRIEARGIGILTAPAAGPTDLALVVDLGRAETRRLPPPRTYDLLGIPLPLVHGPLRPGLAAALLQMLTGGMADPERPGIPASGAGLMEGTVMQDHTNGTDQARSRPDHEDAAQHVVLVTGPSGAGRSTAINVLEDLGYEAIDNLPLSLVSRLLDGPVRGVPLALGLDVRNRDFSAAALIALIDDCVERPDIALTTLYLDCAPDQLVRRYSETRRRHPLAPDDDPLSGVLAERNLMEPIRARADVLVDTTETSPHDLKAELTRWFGDSASHGMTISVQSFSYKRGTPRGIDIMFDVRFLENPHWVPELRELDGRDAAVQAYVHKDPRFAEFMDRITGLIRFLLPAHQQEGKSHLAIGIGCTGGQHRSVTVTENLAQMLAQEGWHVSKRHRELERYAAVRSDRTARSTHPM